MEKTLPMLHDALAEGGNLKTSVHKDIKTQFGIKLETLGLEVTPNGEFALAVANASGKIVYVRVSAVVTLNDPFVKKEKKARKTKLVDTPEVPVLF